MEISLLLYNGSFQFTLNDIICWWHSHAFVSTYTYMLSSKISKCNQVVLIKSKHVLWKTYIYIIRLDLH